MFDKHWVIPGITEGNLSTMEPVVDSDVFRRELINCQRTEELFRNEK